MSRSISALFLFSMFAAAVPRLATAQTLLALKFAAGEQYDLHVEQKTSSTVTVNNKPVKTTIEMTLESQWSVESAEANAARIKQVVKHVQVKMQLADGPPVEYDSQSATQPGGAARDLAAAVKPLLDPESSIELTVNERGEILAAELSPRLAELWKANDEKGAPKESLDALLKQPLVVLPDKPVSESDTWKISRDLATPAGKYKQETTYTYAGRKESAGRPVDEIHFESRLTPVQPGKAKVKEQSQTGTILLADFEKEKRIESVQQQKLVTESPYRESTITVVVETEVKRTLRQK